jgi:hypothetical protein
MGNRQLSFLIHFLNIQKRIDSTTEMMMLVVIGGFSPVVIYFGLEAGVKNLSNRLDEDK